MALRLLLPVLVLLVPAVVVLRSRGRVAVPREGRLAEVASTTGRWRLAGCVLGLVVAPATVGQGALGRGLMLAAPLFALCVLLGVVVGELRVRAPQGSTRSADLGVRRVGDYLPRGLGTAVAVATALLAALLAVGTALGSADDLGRAGRALSNACSAVSAQTRGPWPGSFYALPLAVVVLAGLVVAGLALARVVTRPRQGEDVALDDALRRSSASSVTAAVGLLVTVPLAGVGTFAASGLLGICAAPAWWTATGLVLLGAVPFALGLGVLCAALLLRPVGLAPAPAVR